MRDDFPFFANTGQMLLLFGVTLIILDVVLIRLLNLKRTTWKRMDYISLGLAAFGLIGAVSEVRQLIASNELVYSRQRVTFWFSQVRSAIDPPPTYVCTSFVRGPSSPPPEEFNRTQREYDEVCAWFKQLGSVITRTTQEMSSEIVWSTLPQPPNISDTVLKSDIAELRKSFDQYNSEFKVREELELKAKRSELEVTVLALTPLFLMAALALSITKVTADMKLGA